MNPRINHVIANDEYMLTLAFTNGERRVFDMKPYLELGFFRELKDSSYFKAVRTEGGTVLWPNGQDVCPDTLYEESACDAP